MAARGGPSIGGKAPLKGIHCQHSFIVVGQRPCIGQTCERAETVLELYLVAYVGDRLVRLIGEAQSRKFKVECSISPLNAVRCKPFYTVCAVDAGSNAAFVASALKVVFFARFAVVIAVRWPRGRCSRRLWVVI